MAPEERRRIVGAALLIVVLGFFAAAITDISHGLVTAGFVAVALIVAKGL